jgi:hypothetical protein
VRHGFNRRALWGWLGGLAVAGGLFGYAWLRSPVLPEATAGADFGRSGFVAMAMALPVLLAAWRMGRFNDRNDVAAWALPVILAAGLGILAGAFAVIPDDVRYCNQVIDAGMTPPAHCSTPSPARLAILAEAAGVWLVFGMLTAAARRWVPREESTSSGAR